MIVVHAAEAYLLDRTRKARKDWALKQYLKLSQVLEVVVAMVATSISLNSFGPVFPFSFLQDISLAKEKP